MPRHYEKSYSKLITMKTTVAKEFGKQIPPFGLDEFKRPEIRNGTFYLDGRPTYLLGPFLHLGTGADADQSHLAQDAGPSVRDAYRRRFDAAMAPEFGMNMAQIPYPVDSLLARRFTPERWVWQHERGVERLHRWLKALGGTPRS